MEPTARRAVAMTLLAELAELVQRDAAEARILAALLRSVSGESVLDVVQGRGADYTCATAVEAMAAAVAELLAQLDATGGADAD